MTPEPLLPASPDGIYPRCVYCNRENYALAVIDYLHDNYYDDMERMAHIKMIVALTTDANTHYSSIPSMIDKVALFNGIAKSYPPKPEEMAREFIEGASFIMFLDRAGRDWGQTSQRKRGGDE